MDPLALVLIAAAVVSAFCWIASLITKDTSWVDRIWSIVPVVYVWIFAAAALVEGANATRLVVMALLVTAWGARLTFNFARKGGYSGVEDYRWAVLRGRMKPWQFQLFNLFFIVLYQNALLVLISLPASSRGRTPRRSRVGMPRSRCSSPASCSASSWPTSSSGDSTRPSARPADSSSRGSRRPGSSPTAVTPTSSSSRPSGGRSMRSAPPRPRHPDSASGAGRSTGRSRARPCSPCCSSARPSSPSRSPRRSTPRTGTTSARHRCSSRSPAVGARPRRRA